MFGNVYTNRFIHIHEIKTTKFIIGVLFFLVPFYLNAQNIAINKTGAVANNSAMLDISSTEQGIIVPRLTNAERNVLPSPAVGLIIFNTSTNAYNYYKATGWYELGFSFQSSAVGINSTGENVAINETGNPADASAILDISSNTRGILIPRTTEASLTAVTGLIYYDTALARVRYYDGTLWRSICENFITSTTGVGVLPSLGVSFNVTGVVADPSSILDVSSTSKGLLIPRMTDVERALMLPVTGLTIYNLTTNSIDYYNGTDWNMLEHSAPVITLQPVDDTICSGGSYNPQVVATGPPLTYQWQFSPNGTSGWVNVANGTPVNSIYANSNSPIGFTVSGNISPGIYYYHCIVSGASGCGSTTSNVVALTVQSVPVATITASCNPGDVTNGTYCCYPSTLYLYGNSPGAISWSWTGPNSFTSTLQNPVINVTSPLQHGTYYLIPTNTCGPGAQVSKIVTVELRPNSICD